MIYALVKIKFYKGDLVLQNYSIQIPLENIFGKVEKNGVENTVQFPDNSKISLNKYIYIKVRDDLKNIPNIIPNYIPNHIINHLTDNFSLESIKNTLNESNWRDCFYINQIKGNVHPILPFREIYGENYEIYQSMFLPKAITLFDIFYLENKNSLITDKINIIETFGNPHFLSCKFRNILTDGKILNKNGYYDIVNYSYIIDYSIIEEMVSDIKIYCSNYTREQVKNILLNYFSKEFLFYDINIPLRTLLKRLVQLEDFELAQKHTLAAMYYNILEFCENYQDEILITKIEEVLFQITNKVKKLPLDKFEESDFINNSLLLYVTDHDVIVGNYNNHEILIYSNDVDKIDKSFVKEMDEILCNI